MSLALDVVHAISAFWQPQALWPYTHANSAVDCAETRQDEKRRKPAIKNDSRLFNPDNG
jgi:hypothetical protein